MKGDKQYKIEIEELIIRGAYGDLNFLEKRKLEKALKKNPELEEVFNRYKASANMVKADTADALSDNFEENLFRKAGISGKSNSSFFQDLLSMLIERPVKIAGAFTLVIMMIFASFITDIRMQEREFSENEIENANREASKALMLVSRVFTETREEFAENILKSRVARPINKGIGIVNSILTNGDKNEKNNL